MDQFLVIMLEYLEWWIYKFILFEIYKYFFVYIDDVELSDSSQNQNNNISQPWKHVELRQLSIFGNVNNL